MNREEFMKYIKSIGFKDYVNIEDRFLYGMFYIDVNIDSYLFGFRNVWIDMISFNDIDIFKKYFIKELRSIKLGKLIKNE